MGMNADIKVRWTAALRSGEYPQGKEYLRTDEGFCCLGVLCDLAVKAGVIEYEKGPFRHYYDGVTSVLPQTVMDWAGLHEDNPAVSTDSLPEGVTWGADLDDQVDTGLPALANMNDGGTTFSVIADIIDAQL